VLDSRPMPAPVSFFKRRSIFLRLLSYGLGAGALYDFSRALALVLVPAAVSEISGLLLPAEAISLWLPAVWLMALAGAQVLAAIDPVRYAGIVTVAIGLRSGAGLLMLAVAWRGAELAALLPLAGLELTLAAVLVVGGRLLRS